MVEAAGNISSVLGVVLQVGKWVAAPIGRRFMYLYNYNTNFDNLQEEVNTLKNAKHRVEREVDAAERNVEEIEENVKKWQNNVEKTVVQAERLIQDKSNNLRCLKGLCPNLKTRYKHSKKAFKLKRDDIGPLLLQEEKFDRVSYPTVPLEKNFDKLGDDVLKLKNARRKVQRKVDEAKNNVEEIEEDVKKWLEDVDSIIVKAEELIENQSSIGTDRKTRYQNSKAASELMVDNIGPLLQQEERFDKVSHPTIHKEIWLRYNEDYLAFESRNSIEKNVWEALKDEKIYMIGVYGMSGLGKTTLVQEIGRKAEKDKLFDEIVFVEVTESPDTKKIQTAIANKLGVKFDDAMEDESQRASKLYSRIEKGNILLIADNIWRKLDLKIVGIPYEVDRGRSKILMTTRNVDVLEKMGFTKKFQMSILNKEEAWSLFQKMAGNVIQTSELNSLPKDVCKECGDLPIVICTIAKALRNKRQKSQWADALRILRMPSPAKFTRLLEEEYLKIKLSYDYLDGEELKKTFIISSLMGNDTSIFDLLKNIVGLGILEGANLTIEQARNRLDSVVKELKDCCLLLDGETEGSFSMHDVIRIVALTCAYMDCHVLTERNDIEREWEDEDKLRECTMISLVGNNIITQLRPEALDCPKLEFLRGSSFEIPKEFFTVMPKLKVLNLCGIQQSLPSSLDLLTNLQTLCLDDSEIEDVAIIGKLKKLKVLSLQNTNIEELSTEMDQLTRLKILDLRNCGQLKVIAPNVISKLSQLEELYIMGCRFQWDNRFPTLMSSSYQNLTRFILEQCGKIKYVFPSSIAKNLQTLQHLEIMDCEVLEEIVAEEGAKDTVNFAFPQVTYLKLKKLPNLTAFYPGIHTCKLPMLRRFVIKECEKFSSKHLSFLENSFSIPKPKSLCLEHKIDTDLEVYKLKNGWKTIIWQSQSKALKIFDYKSANISLGLLQRFENLNELKLKGYAYKELLFPNLPDLEVLDVSFCFRLMSLVPSSTSFQNLKVLRVDYCNGLIKLITPSIARSLAQLRKMSICDCRTLIEIVENGGEGDATSSTEIVFDNLKTLSLVNLECLKCFCYENYSFNFPSLEELIIRECPNMKTFSQGILNTPKLHEIDYEDEKKDLENGGSDPNTIIQQAHTKKVDSNLKGLTLSGRDIKSLWEGEFQENFGKVKTLQLIKDEYASIPIQILHKFNSLEKLVLKMNSYKEIFSFEEDEEHDGALTKLKVLELRELFNLKCIWEQDFRLNSILQNLDCLEVQYCHNLTTLLPFLASFENLRTLIVSYCNGMENLMSSSTAKTLVRLEYLSIGRCETMTEVLANEEGIEKCEIVFEKLKNLYLHNLESLTCFCSGNCTLKFPNLEMLSVYECSKMKTFFGGDLSMPRLQVMICKDCSDLNTTMEQARPKKGLTLSGRHIISIWEGDSSKLWETFQEEEEILHPRTSTCMTGVFFNMKHCEDQIQAGEWDEVEHYIRGFTKVDDNKYSMKIFFDIRKHKYYEALDREDRAKAVEILVKDLKFFAAFNEKIFKEITQLLTLDNFRQNEQLSYYRDTKSARNIMLVELKNSIELNPLLRDKLTFPAF